MFENILMLEKLIFSYTEAVQNWILNMNMYFGLNILFHTQIINMYTKEKKWI